MRSALPVLADTFVAPPFIEPSPVAALSEAAAAKDRYGWKPASPLSDAPNWIPEIRLTAGIGRYLPVRFGWTEQESGHSGRQEIRQVEIVVGTEPAVHMV
jgi:hypothetical protein